MVYHSKAGYLKIGNEDSFFPLSLELGLEMACEFGGKPYRRDGHGNMQRIPTGTGVKDFWNAFIPGGSDATDGVYTNRAGNQLGSWVARLTSTPNCGASRYTPPTSSKTTARCSCSTTTATARANSGTHGRSAATSCTV